MSTEIASLEESMKTTHAVVALALAALAGAAQAQPYGQRYGGYGHQGLYVHFELGLGGMETKTSGAAPELTLSGAAGQFAIAVGGSITPQLGLGAELWEAAGWSPNVRASDGSASFTSDDSSSFTLLGLGPRLTFWIAPEYLNMYLSATPSLTWLSYDINGERRSNKTGAGLRLAVGKEWWLVHSQWGFGISAQLHLASNRDRDFNEITWKTVGGGINFSTTWN